MYLIIGVSGAIFIGCIVICCCYVRRMHLRKQNANRVKKYRETSADERLKKYRYNKGKTD